MKRTFFSAFIACLFFNCQYKQTNNNQVERISLPVVVLNDSIESVMPGQLVLTDDYILWTDPIHSDFFVHVLDRVSGKELGKAVQIGQGPNEFITPSAAIRPKNELFIFDFNSERTGVFSFPAALQGNGIFASGKMEIKDVTALLFINSKEWITLTPTLSTPFALVKEKSAKAFGELPVKGELATSHHFQGNIAYNPEKEYLIYSTFTFPYFAIYHKKGDSFTLVKELFLSDEYEVRHGTFSYRGERMGAIQLALTSDYIVTLERDRKFDNTDEKIVGRDFSKLPRTVFLYNYDLQLKKIINLGAPVLRIATDTKTNTLYAIVVNPDFMLVKCEL